MRRRFGEISGECSDSEKEELLLIEGWEKFRDVRFSFVVPRARKIS